MAKKRKGKARVPLPPAGPPTNLRPGGPHADKAEKKRAEEIREALRRQDIDNEQL